MISASVWSAIGYRCLRPLSVSACAPDIAAFSRARPNPGFEEIQPTSSGSILTSKTPSTRSLGAFECAFSAAACCHLQCGAWFLPPSPQPPRLALSLPSPQPPQRLLPSLSEATSDDAPPPSPRDPIMDPAKSPLVSQYRPLPQRGRTARLAVRSENGKAKMLPSERRPSRSCPASPALTTCHKKVSLSRFCSLSRSLTICSPRPVKFLLPPSTHLDYSDDAPNSHR